MAAGSQRAILLFTGLLLFVSIIVITLDENSSNNTIFVVIFSTSIITLLWKILSTQNKTQTDGNSSSIKLDNSVVKSTQKIDKTVVETNVPDPLDQEIDIPLM